MPERRMLALFALVLLGAFITSCRFDSPSAETKTPPLFLRATVPGDSATSLFDGEDMNLVLEFNRRVDPQRVHVRFFPALAEPADPPTTSSRSLVWRSIRLDPGVVGYRVVIDSPDMPDPELITLFPGRPLGRHGRIRGRIRITNPPRDGRSTLVMALRARPGDPPSPHLERVFDLAVESAALSQDLPNDDAGIYGLGFLRHPAQYVVLAIHDTSGDGLYDLETDWWGLPREIGLVWTPLAVADTALCEAIGIDIDLLPPGGTSFVEPPEAYDPQPYCGGQLQN